MQRLLHLVISVCSLFVQVSAQDPEYARKVVNDLCSEEMAGRGYVKEGAQKAAEYLSASFRRSGLQSFGADYFQPIGYPVIAFPYEVSVKADNNELIPGEEFIIGAGCPSVRGVFDAVYVDSATLDNNLTFSRFEKTGFSHTCILLDIGKEVKLNHPERLEAIRSYQYKARAILFLNQAKLTWGVATGWDKYPMVYVLSGALKGIPQKVSLNIEPEVRTYNGNNVVGYIKGTRYPDSFVVFSAHYDHLGMMGRWAVFPGGNDNASGVAMMLDLMHYYTEHPPAYSVCFIGFTGEEAGLFGSYYYTEHPLFPLDQIAMLINLDLMGTGDKGMTVVNATLFPDEFQELQLINLTGNYLTTVNARGKAENSDHYYFSEHGVKAFFFYLMGEYKAYHDVNDTAEAVTFSRYSEAFRLIRDFVNEYQK